jgi:hypothetical protein
MKETQYILDSISNLIDISKAEISTENLDYKKRKYLSDFVLLNKSDNIGFEVFEGEEIIVFYLREHEHFYGAPVIETNDIDLADQAIDLLKTILTCKAKYIQVYKGEKLLKETIYFLINDQWEKGCTTNYRLVTKINPFAKKTIRETIWEFNDSDKSGI